MTPITWPPSPTPDEIAAGRAAVGLTQREAGAVLDCPSYRTWQDWERGAKPMRGRDWQVWRWCVGLDPWPASPVIQQPENQPAKPESDRDQHGTDEGQ
jgi:hypothetical protein